MFGVDCEPNVRGTASDIGEIERLLYGTGFYGSASNTGPGSQMSPRRSTEGYVEVRSRCGKRRAATAAWRRRRLAGWAVARRRRRRVLRDGVRPAAFPHTSPLNTFEFVRIPGRNGGTTPVEALTPIQRAYNAGYGQIKRARQPVVESEGRDRLRFGLKPGKFTNKPGENYVLNRRPGVPAIEYIAHALARQDVYKMHADAARGVRDIGFANAQDQSNPGDSGEKVKEVRFNTDRFLGPTMRRERGRVRPRLRELAHHAPADVGHGDHDLSYAGDDNIARTITVFPEMFKEGYVNIRPDVESMLPEGRGERQEQDVQDVPGRAVRARRLARGAAEVLGDGAMPHLSRAAKPGGIHTTTAEQENGKLLLGAPAQEIPVYEWYDDDAHLAVHENFMASPEFEKLAPPLKDAFTMHRMAHKFTFPGDASGGDAGAAPGSAPALVGEGGQIVVMPGTGAALPDNRSAVERASDAARASIAANGTALKEPGAAQPRANDGTFQPKPRAADRREDARANRGRSRRR
jgi:hypothetical protein